MLFGWQCVLVQILLIFLIFKAAQMQPLPSLKMQASELIAPLLFNPDDSMNSKKNFLQKVNEQWKIVGFFSLHCR